MRSRGPYVGVPVFRFKEICSIPAGLVTFGYKVAPFHLPRVGRKHPVRVNVKTLTKPKSARCLRYQSSVEV
jgi:hypothetical protein